MSNVFGSSPYTVISLFDCADSQSTNDVLSTNATCTSLLNVFIQCSVFKAAFLFFFPFVFRISVLPLHAYRPAPRKPSSFLARFWHHPDLFDFSSVIVTEGGRSRIVAEVQSTNRQNPVHKIPEPNLEVHRGSNL